MSAQHTPGPWGVRNTTEVFCGRKRVCHVNAASREDLNMLDDQRVAMANARLIAAAPDLLDALQYVMERIVDRHDPDEAAISARAAIAKAIGETK